jgi:tetratricopeptide (TPR) repeat protein/CHAT domain-containing protein
MTADHGRAGQDREIERLERLAAEYYRHARYGEAEAVLAQVLNQRQKVQGLDHPEVATALNNLGLVHKVQGRFGKAETLYRQALAIREKALGPNHPEVAASLNNLGELYRAQGRHDDAEPLFRRALAISERALGPNHPDVARSLNSLALLCWTRGDFAEAERLYRRALAILRETRGSDHAEVALLLTNLAELSRARGRYGEAEQAFRRALGILEAALGPDHPEVAGTLSNLGTLYRVQGRYREAEPLYQRALNIVGVAPDLDPSMLAVSLNNLALVYRAQGRYREAEPLYRRSVDTYERIHGPGHRDLATMLNNLAGLFWAQERHADAEPLYRRALTILERVLTPAHPDVATSMNNLAALYAAQERHGEAEPLYRRALEILEKTLGPDHPEVARGLHNLASLYRSEGRDGEAEPLYRRALAAREGALGPDHPDVAATLHNVASLCDRQERHAEALVLVRRASAIGRRRAALGRQPRASGVSAEQASLSSRYRFHLRVLSGAVDEGEIGPREGAEEGFELAQLALRSRAERAIARMAARFAAGEGVLAGMAREREDALDRLEAAEEAFMQEISKAPGQRHAEAEPRLRTRIARAEADIARLDAVLAERFPAYADLVSPEPLGLAKAQALLGEDEALVVYVAGEGASHVLVARRDDARFLGLGPGGQALAESVAVLRGGLDPRRGGTPSPRDGTADARRDLALGPGGRAKAGHFDVERAHQLYLEIWAPIEPFLSGVKCVFVVPDQALESLPFHVLVTRPPPAKLKQPERLRGVGWLARREYALAVLPSAGALRGLRELASKTKRGDGFIGFGDPVLGGERSPELPTVSLDWRGIVADVESLWFLRPLPESAGELKQLAQSLRAPRTALFLGPRATERQVRALNRSKDLAGAGVLAFATHGVMAGELSGFNEPGLVLTPPEQPSEEDDGFLAASEIAELDLNADWVLLSACNTAAADGTPGAEGLSGLAPAFFYAGARALLVSHWSVYSEAAVELTTGTFDRLRQKRSIGRAEALRRTMVELVDRGPDPSPAYWAPFVIVGEVNV